MWHQTVLLKHLPPVAAAAPVVAKVEVFRIETREEPGLVPFRVALARVIEPIKSVVEGQVIAIHATGTSCGGSVTERDLGRQAYIAGDIYDRGYFRGRWSAKTLGAFRSCEFQTT
jgi:hypothetical protein